MNFEHFAIFKILYYATRYTLHSYPSDLTFYSGKLAVFTVLCEQYQISLNRDPCYRQYLDKIGQLFFNIPPPRPRNQGLFGSLLQSFFNGLEDDDLDDEQRNTASTSHAVQELD